MNNPFAPLLVIVTTCLIAASASAQREEGETSFRMMQYNVENLFDTLHDAGYDDYEFLPNGSKKWDSRRYWAKQARLSRVIAAAGGASPIDIVSLCEVENDSVVYDLCRKTKLHWLGYEFLMTKSSDARGIDVALLYQPGTFKPLSHTSIRIPYAPEKERPTRDILHVSGLLQTGDTLDVFVCHWPSRRGGSAQSMRYRKRAAKLLRSYADSVRDMRQNSLEVFMGDFNDEEEDASIAVGLGAKIYKPGITSTNPNEIYVLQPSSASSSNSIRGTYKFRGQWNRLDHIMLSGNIFSPSSSLRYVQHSYRIFAPPFLLQKPSSGSGYSIARTYLGPIYKGGTSDHLPLLVDLTIGLNNQH